MKALITAAAVAVTLFAFAPASEAGGRFSIGFSTGGGCYPPAYRPPVYYQPAYRPPVYYQRPVYVHPPVHYHQPQPCYTPPPVYRCQPYGGHGY